MGHMTTIDNYPPGLLSRRWFPIDRGRIVVHEEWDIDVPGCPIIRSPWHAGIGDAGSRFVRQVVMTEEEFRRSGVDGQSRSDP